MVRRLLTTLAGITVVVVGAGRIERTGLEYPNLLSRLILKCVLDCLMSKLIAVSLDKGSEIYYIKTIQYDHFSDR